MGNDLYAQFAQKSLADRTYGHPHRGFAGTRTLQYIPHIFTVIFQNPRQIRMTGTGCRDFFPFWLTKGGHAAVPVGKVLVDYLQGQWAAQCFIKTHAGEDFYLVRLNLHAPATAIALLAAGKFPVNILLMQLQPGRQALQNRCQPRSMGLARRHKTQLAHTIHLIVAIFHIYV